MLVPCKMRRKKEMACASGLGLRFLLTYFDICEACKLDACSSAARYVYADGSAYKGTWSADSLDGEVHPQGAEATC